LGNLLSRFKPTWGFREETSIPQEGNGKSARDKTGKKSIELALRVRGCLEGRRKGFRGRVRMVARVRTVGQLGGELSERARGGKGRGLRPLGKEGPEMDEGGGKKKERKKIKPSTWEGALRRLQVKVVPG